MSFDFLELAKQFGPFVAFTVYFVWQGWQREKRQTTRIDELENRQRDMLTNLVVESTTALTNNTRIMERMEKVMERYCDDRNPQ